MKSTKALVVRSFVEPPAILNWEVEAVGSNQVRIRIESCGLNFADLLMLEGKYQDTPALPFVPGLEVAGVVEQIGDDVRSIRVGQRVIAYEGCGGLASHVVVDAERCRALPDSMSFVTGAGFQVAYGTSHLALRRRAGLAAGETLIVLGASGGVGLTAVEIGKAIGATVIAVARGDEKLSIAQKAGADHLIDSEVDDLRAELKKFGPIQVAYDSVGGEQGQAAFRALEPEGRHIVIGFASGAVPNLKPNHMMVKNINVIGFNLGAYQKFAPTALTESFAELMRWHGKGLIHPHVSHILPLERAMEGLELLRTRKSTGKIVITP